MANYKDWTYVTDDTVAVADGAVSNPKKLTGTRLGAVVGLNKWKSPFGAWCEICRVAEEPFVDNKYTAAGNILEPMLLERCKREVSPHIVTPEEFYGVADAKKHTRYDFFKHAIFGGMWDALVTDGHDTTLAVIEAKTTSRPQDWVDGVPDSYAVQALMYAVLLGVGRAFVPVAMLDPKDYDDPASFVCTDDNTHVYELNVETWTDSQGRNIAEVLDIGAAWWDTHVVGNVSPRFDASAKRDKTYLDIMRNNEITVHSELEALAKEVALLETRIEDIRSTSGIDDMEKRLKTLKDKQLKPMMADLLSDTDETITAYGWKLKRTESTTIDEEALKSDGIYDQYTTTTVSYRLTKEN